MRFKSLELHGFKSFVEPTKVEFEDGITAIVGPNGCGKSNIADGLRWVLGEQSAKIMRGSKMEDFIFNGAGARKPMGFAEVTLTISGLEGSVSSKPYSEFEEIAVTRKLYRNGESDYLINQVPCRLKDIVDIFLDTGVNARALSIIEQDQVERIINSKPEERRVFIDEAAGIMKYKVRRNAALNKLEAGQQNLLRIQDIIAELERQRNSLNRQAKKAERYQSFRKEIREQGLIHYASEYQNYSNRVSELLDSLEELKNHEIGLTANLSTHRNELETLKIKITGQEKQILDLKERFGKADSSIERNDHHRQLLSRQVSDIANEKENSQSEINSLEQELDESESLIKERSEELEQLTEMIQKKQECIDKLRQALEKAQSQVDLFRSNLKIGLDSANNNAEQISNSQSKQSSINGRLDVLISRLDALKNQDEKLKTDVLTNTENKKELETILQNYESNYSATKQKENSISQALGLATEELSQADNKLSDITSEFTKHESRLESLRELERNFEGYGEGVRKLMKLKGEKYKGTEGISRILTEEVKAKSEFETALASTFGSKLEALITSNSTEAATVLGILKADSLGIASFTVADMIPNEKQTPPNPPAHPSLMGRASELFEVDKKRLEGVFRLLTITLIASDLAGAIEIWKAVPGSFNVVTIDGDTIDRSGFITGGSEKAGTGIVSRRRIIEELEEKVTDLNIIKDTAKNTKNTKVGSKQSLEAELGNCQADVRKLELEIVGINNKISNIDLASSRDEENIRSLDTEQSHMIDTKDQLRLELDGLTEVVTAYKKERIRIEASNVSSQKSIDQAVIELDMLRGELQTEELGLAEQKGTEKNVELDIERIEELKANGLNRISKLRKVISEADSKILETNNSMESIAKETVEFGKDKDCLNGKIIEVNNVLEDELASVMGLEEICSRLQKELKELQPKMYEISIAKSEADLRLENIIERADVEFSIPLEDLSDMSMEQHDVNEVNNRLTFLRSELAKIVDVNLSALEEYEQINDRWNFLKSQRDDLVKSIATLHKTIENIKTTTNKMFMETFSEVSKNFGKVFVRLFGGGRAEMRLVSENDSLDPGVDIFVQPPGKKIQNINLLSSGEKALTAIAMLFAVFEAKPTPFCLLDEIDAPLSETNIVRFLDLVSEMQGKTQFLIITHSQKTMGFADRLYGVTHQEEEGVSKVLAVSLKNEREPAPLAVA
ncbi:MAG TPA: chromosome segregation protein SMC [Nitrospinota bacterium]|nr:chromosome segregation protein SMC [Nitrospinota bacterium]